MDYTLFHSLPSYSKMQRAKLLLCLVCILILNGCGYTTIRQHKDFTKIFPKYRTVAIIPAEILIEKQTKKGKQVTAPAQVRIDSVINDAKAKLSKNGYIVTGSDDDFGSEKNASNFMNEYKQATSGLYGVPALGKKENAFTTNETIGEIAGSIAKKSNADLLFVLSYSGREMAQEVIAKNLAKDVSWAMIGVQNDSHVKEGSAIISFIDRRSGKLLWTNLGTDFETYGESLLRVVTNKNVMETAFDKVLKTIPDKEVVN